MASEETGVEVYSYASLFFWRGLQASLGGQDAVIPVRASADRVHTVVGRQGGVHLLPRMKQCTISANSTRMNSYMNSIMRSSE